MNRMAQMTDARLNSPLAYFESAMLGAEAQQRQIPLGQLIAQAVRETTGVDVGLASSAAINPRGLPAGEVRVRDIYAPLGGYTRQHLVVTRVRGEAIQAMVRTAITPEKHAVQVAGLTLDDALQPSIDGQPIDTDRLYLLAAPRTSFRISSLTSPAWKCCTTTHAARASAKC